MPSPSQREAIEAGPRSQLVLAGPGAGKTYCLTERIRFLIDHLGFDPARICAFTFTNKAAGEIAHRLETSLGAAAAKVKRGTIHAFCAELLRELGSHIALDPGLRHRRRGVSAERARADRRSAPLASQHADALFGAPIPRRAAAAQRRGAVRAVRALSQRAPAAGLRPARDRDGASCSRSPNAGALVRSRWDAVLVDEFQDVNPVQYRVIRALARGPQARVRRGRRRAVDLLVGGRGSGGVQEHGERLRHRDEDSPRGESPVPARGLRARAKARDGEHADLRRSREPEGRARVGVSRS